MNYKSNAMLAVFFLIHVIPILSMDLNRVPPESRLIAIRSYMNVKNYYAAVNEAIKSKKKEYLEALVPELGTWCPSSDQKRTLLRRARKLDPNFDLSNVLFSIEGIMASPEDATWNEFLQKMREIIAKDDSKTESEIWSEYCENMEKIPLEDDSNVEESDDEYKTLRPLPCPTKYQEYQVADEKIAEMLDNARVTGRYLEVLAEVIGNNDIALLKMLVEEINAHPKAMNYSIDFGFDDADLIWCRANKSKNRDILRILTKINFLVMSYNE